MTNNILKNKQGFTFMELLIVVAIIAVITTIFVVNIRNNDDKKLALAADELASDIRFARNLALSRTAYDFEDGNGPVYPVNGYGVDFRPASGGLAAFYFIYADKGPTFGYNTPEGDQDMKRIYLEDTAWQFNDVNKEPWVSTQSFRFNFVIEDEITTNLSASANQDYAIQVANPKGGYPNVGYAGVIQIAEGMSDGMIKASIGNPSYNDIDWVKPDVEEDPIPEEGGKHPPPVNPY
jgi:prepilin-type N-terminal cleavage/methylation domain-containing protein